MKIRSLLCGVCVALFGMSGGAQSPQTLPYDHIHLAASDPEKAYDWYITNLGGQAGENTGRIIFEPFAGGRPLPLQLMFIKAADAAPSDGGAIDSIGFSFGDVEAKVKALQAAGASVVMPVSAVSGSWKRAVVVDPWGVKIELVEDRSRLGFHHIALRVADPGATTRWHLSAFGGERVKRGGADALQYGQTYVVVLQGEGTAPSQGRAIDHLGWGPSSMDRTANDLEAKGIAFASQPQPKPNQLGHRTAYVVAPGGVRIELVEHAECAWGKGS